MEDEDNTEMKKFFNQILYMLKVISVDQYKNDTDIDINIPGVEEEAKSEGQLTIKDRDLFNNNVQYYQNIRNEYYSFFKQFFELQKIKEKYIAYKSIQFYYIILFNCKDTIVLEQDSIKLFFWLLIQILYQIKNSATIEKNDTDFNTLYILLANQIDSIFSFFKV